jgi:hypothetical protein
MYAKTDEDETSHLNVLCNFLPDASFRVLQKHLWLFFERRG